MANYKSFGEFFKKKRMEMGLTLREFCIKNGFDPGNISKIERGLMAAPTKEDLKERYAKALGIFKNSDDWLEFCDLAATSAGRIPSDIVGDEELLESLPILFRTVRNSKKKHKQLDKFVNYIRENLR